MTHNGINYTLTAAADARIWHWQFELAGRLIAGKTRTTLKLLAARKVAQRIDRELRHSRSKARGQVDPGA
jgi:hypothetical protein